MSGGPTGAFAAVDLGASSGRVILGQVGSGVLAIEEVHRFPNEPVPLPDALHWDASRLYQEVLVGLKAAAKLQGDIRSVGVDGWGVDYGLLDRDGRLVAEPYAYRDPRSARGVAWVHERIPQDLLYARSGLQFLPFNTIYQLAASIGAPELEAAATMLLMPDLIGYWLSGARVAEATNASTTGLLDVQSRGWALDVVDAIGLPGRILPELQPPGQQLSGLREDVVQATGLPPATTWTLIGSHDTASAVVGVPAEGDRFAYISCGTWGLVGVEIESPILSDASRLANFTNEGGVDGRIRFLRNVTGLWLLQESVRAWASRGEHEGLAGLLAAAAELPPGGPRIDPNAPVFLPPGDMPARIVDECRATDQPLPTTRPMVVRCILDSLAAAFAGTLREAVALSGKDVRVIHLVGGGSQNGLLCQLTADACELPVAAGPVEATAIGNVLVQARAHGILHGALESLRELVRRTHPVRVYQPRARIAVGR